MKAKFGRNKFKYVFKEIRRNFCVDKDVLSKFDYVISKKNLNNQEKQILANQLVSQIKSSAFVVNIQPK